MPLESENVIFGPWLVGARTARAVRPRDPDLRHEDGRPARKGDRVAVYGPGYSAVGGLIVDVGVIGAVSGERSYAVMCDDGIVRVAPTRNLSFITPRGQQ